MGGGIAMNFANAGIPVTVVEVDQEALDRGLGVVRKNYEATAARGRLTARGRRQAHGPDHRHHRLRRRSRTPTSSIEAVFEEMAIKKEVFARLDESAKPDAVLATNTSTLDVDEIASATKRPESVIGMHFFSPANVMRLLEIVRGKKSSKDDDRHGHDARPAHRQGAGAGRRLLRLRGQPHAPPARPRGREADPGGRAAARRWTRCSTDFGFPMGPFAMGDLAGLDVGWRIRKGTRARTSTGAPTASASWGASARRPARLLQVREGRPHADPRRRGREDHRGGVERAWASRAARSPTTEILARLLYPMVNEGAKILEEKIAHPGQRHRRDLGLRLRLAGLPRRPDVLGRLRSGSRRCATA